MILIYEGEIVMKQDKSEVVSVNVNKKLVTNIVIYALVFTVGGIAGYFCAGKFNTKTVGLNGQGQNTGQFGTAQSGMMGGRGMGRGGQLFGEVTKVDGNTITIKLSNGNTQEVTVGSSTTYKTTATATKDSVKVGSTISVASDTSSSSTDDTTTTATSVIVQ